MNIAGNIEVPTNYWFVNITDSYVMWTCWANDLSCILRHVIVTTNMKVQVFIGDKDISFDTKIINNMQEIKQILITLQTFFPCENVNDKSRINNCHGFVIKRKLNTKMRCLPCTKSWKALLRKAHNIKSTQKLKIKHRKLQNSILNCKRLEERLRSKISKLCHKIKDLKNKCSKCNEKAIKDVIKKLPQNQQLAVETCFAAAKLNDKKGMRYSTEWVYECQSSKIPQHLNIPVN